MQLTEERRRLVEENMELVFYLVNKLNVPGNIYDDIAQIGMVGLCKAALMRIRV